jgi:hypothetical protein
MENSECTVTENRTKDSSEGCENSSSDSGSQEQEDLFEAPAATVALPEVPHRRTDRKAQFRGFYVQQMTLVQTDSTDSLLSRADQEMEKIADEAKVEVSGEVKIPAIVEDLVSKSDEENEAQEEDTECSEVKVNHGIQDLHLDSLDVVYDTSDEDLSEIGVDKVSPKPAKSRLRISLKNLGDSDDEKGSDDSVLTPAKNMINRMHDNEDEDEEAVTDESDVEVTGMDYYKIRHQAETPVTTEYSLSWSPKKFKAIREDTALQVPKNQRGLMLPNYPSVDIPSNFELDDHNDEEEIPCKEDDFMTMDDFMDAYRTDYELGKEESKVKISIPAPEDDVGEEADTESLRESIISDSSTRDDVDDDYDNETDMSEIQTSYAENSTCGWDDGLGGDILLMEHDDLEGTIAVYSPSQYKKIMDKMKTISFKPELVTLNDDTEFEEVVSEILDQSCKDMEEGHTDEEDMSEMVDDLAPSVEVELPKAERKMMKICETSEGNMITEELELNDQETDGSDEALTEDELLEDYLLTPFEEAAKKFPEVSGDHYSDGASTVKKSEKNKIRKKVRIDEKDVEKEEEI